MNSNGIGLGLVISENIIKQFGGCIKFSSVFGEGTTMTFTVDLKSELSNSSSMSMISNSDSEEMKFNEDRLVFKWKP